MEVKVLPIDSLKPYRRNARIHPKEQIEQLAKIIKEFGWTNPILVADGVILAGHGRLEAAKLLKLSDVPTIDLSHLSQTQRQAYILADNAVTLQGSFDDDVLKRELEDLNFDGFDMSLTGFTTEDIQKHLTFSTSDLPAGEGEGKSADKKDSVCQPNDIWICGNISLTLDLDADEDCKLADKMIQSWQKNTQRDAIRDEDGETFNNLNRQLQ